MLLNIESFGTLDIILFLVGFLIGSAIINLGILIYNKIFNKK